MSETVNIDGVTLTLGNPVSNTAKWIGQLEPLRQLAACWLTVDAEGLGREEARTLEWVLMPPWIHDVCLNGPIFVDFNFKSEINRLVEKMNSEGKDFIRYYFSLLDRIQLSLEEEMNLVEFAISTIKADDDIKYEEIKFFKNIRHRLKITDDQILEKMPDVEIFLEEDISTESTLDHLLHQYLAVSAIPQLKLVDLNELGLFESKENT
jgi:hypothetical protein